MAKVNFKRVLTNDDVNNLPIEDGNFIVTKDGKAFTDYDNERVGIGGTPDTEMSDTSTNSVENKIIKQYVDTNVGNINNLETTDKTNLVNAINEVNGIATSLPDVKVLWTGGLYMTGAHKIALSESVSSQRHGIVLHWQRYTSGSVQNTDHAYFFIPKSHIQLSSGQGVEMMMSDATFGIVAAKYVYVSDTEIVGNANNEKTGTGASGIKYINNRHVLTQVLGV